MAVVTLIDELLQDQRELTAVDQFAQWHETMVPASPGRYRRLLPATPPGPGEQYAFEVDLDRCSGCKACVTACHSLNGLDEDESWRSVGLLISPRDRVAPVEVPPVQQHITTACHHCVDPACLHGCPVLAYDKDPVTGVVRHLDDQCMGCSYCVMKCPYEVPRYSARLGIVRKCDMCSNRLAVGEAPACAQACPSEAIRITVVDQSQVRQQYRGENSQKRILQIECVNPFFTPPPHPVPTRLIASRNHPLPRRGGGEGSSGEVHGEVEAPTRSRMACADLNPFLPDSPPPALTIPTTRFVSRRVMPEDVRSADRGTLRLDSGHGSLVAMLVMTQAAAGLMLASAVLGWSGYEKHFPVLNPLAGLLLVLGLLASVFHLGRPGKAWRAFLGWRRSWLSREIIAFNAMAVAMGAACLPIRFPERSVLTTVAAAAGFVAVLASSMVYIDTRRVAWRGVRTAGNFFGTTMLLGSTLAAVVLAWMGRGTPGALAAAGWNAALLAMVIRTGLFVWRRMEHYRALADVGSPIHWNARVVDQLLPGTTRWRNLLFIVSTFAGLLAIAGLGDQAHVWTSVAAVATVSSEFIARYVFFAAGGTRRMPGVLTL